MAENKIAVLLSILLIVLTTATTGREWTKKDVVNIDGPEHKTVLTEQELNAAVNFKPVDLRSLGIEVSADPTQGEYFEGDMVLSQDEVDWLKNGASSFKKRSARKGDGIKWENGIVPYMISDYYGDYARGTIAQAIMVYEEKTCIRFVPRTDEDEYVFITPGTGVGCSSNVGRASAYGNIGAQNLNLGEGCIFPGTVEHEMMHAIGFYHEQSRHDRDEYVIINMDKIIPGKESNFKKYPIEAVDTMELPYDFGSVMHYGRHYFAINEETDDTITTINSAYQDTIGQRDRLSDIDLQKINKWYNCPEAATSQEKTANVRPKKPTPLKKHLRQARHATTSDCADPTSECIIDE